MVTPIIGYRTLKIISIWFVCLLQRNIVYILVAILRLAFMRFCLDGRDAQITGVLYICDHSCTSSIIIRSVWIDHGMISPCIHTVLYIHLLTPSFVVLNIHF